MATQTSIQKTTKFQSMAIQQITASTNTFQPTSSTPQLHRHRSPNTKTPFSAIKQADRFAAPPSMNTDSSTTKSNSNRRFNSKENNQIRKERRKQRQQSDAKKHVVNLSSRHLTEVELAVLGKGLGFAPSNSNRPEFKQGIQHLTRTYRLRYFFRNSEPLTTSLPPFKRKSTWQPPKADQITEGYLEKLPSKLSSLAIKPKHPNINRKERAALNNLSKDNNIIVKKADKGTCVVVQDKMEYVNEGTKHLSDRGIYEEIQLDPTEQLSRSINTYIAAIHRKGHLSDHMMEFLTHNDPTKVRTQQLYFIKKLHKTPHDVRPIVSGSSGPTENISSFLDYYLQPLVLKTSSYTRDSKTLITHMEKTTLPEDCLLCTIDVKSLYLNIPQRQGIEAALNHLYREDETPDNLSLPRSEAKTLLEIVLKHNYFEFNEKMFKQIRGTAMGTKVAPSFANLFMDTLETEFLAAEPIKPLIWKRFIDDILCIWPGSETQLRSMLTRLNSHHDTIKFTFEISDHTATFLDTTIYKGPRFRDKRVMDVKPYFKDTNSFQYLHYSSSHPKRHR